MAGLRILILGSTGYIGGSVLSTLLETKNEQIQESAISVLVRQEDQARILAAKGLNPILFRDLDDVETLNRVASEHDVVINTALSFHTASSKALILGLGERKKRDKTEVYYIHTSGTSSLGNRPISVKEHSDDVKVFSDTEDIYSIEKSLEASEVYAQRTNDIVVVEAGLELDVKTYIIMSPTIYGLGTGLFNRTSIQLPTLIRSAIQSGQAEVIGDGKASWDHVSITDLALLYELILAKAIAGEDVPTGKSGIFFAGTGHHTWLYLAQGIAKAGFGLRALKSAEVLSISLQDAADKWAGGNVQLCERAFASNSRTTSEIGHSKLGWKPQCNDDDFASNFEVSFQEILDRKGVVSSSFGETLSEAVHF